MSDAKNISVLGEAVYPHLNKPDVRFNEAGDYKVTLKVPTAKAKEMIQQIDKALESSIAEAEQKNQGKKIKVAPAPYTVEGDFHFFKFKMKATGINRKTKEPFSQRPAIFDAQKNPLSPSISIWGGTKMKVAYQMRNYYTPIIGAGVVLQLIAVQVIELVEGKSQQLDLFDKEDGYVATNQQEQLNEIQATEIQASADF